MLFLYEADISEFLSRSAVYASVCATLRSIIFISLEFWRRFCPSLVPRSEEGCERSQRRERQGVCGKWLRFKLKRVGEFVCVLSQVINQKR